METHNDSQTATQKTNTDRAPLQWGEFDPYRKKNMCIGMWAWMWQRITAIAIIFLLTFHVLFTYKPWVQFLLLMAVAFHATLGLRVILLDFNLVNIKYQRAMIWALTALGFLAVYFIWDYVYGL